jgi:hypothetical protein
MAYAENVNVVRKWEECPWDPEERARWQSFYVTLKPSGELVLSRVTHEAMGAPAGYLLLWDQERQVIGLRGAELGSKKNVFEARPRGPHGGRRIWANRLIRHFGIAVNETVRFHLAQMDRNGVLILDLNCTVPAAKKKRGNGKGKW